MQAAGLPNVEGTIYPISVVNGASTTGAFHVNYHVHTSDLSGTKHYIASIGFSAKNSNSIYGASTTVQPPALTTRFLIRAKS